MLISQNEQSNDEKSELRTFLSLNNVNVIMLAEIGEVSYWYSIVLYQADTCSWVPIRWVSCIWFAHASRKLVIPSGIVAFIF